MAYEYEKDILELLKDIEKERSLDLSKEIDEIQGTYQTARLIDNIVATTKKRLTEQERKAKAWDNYISEVRERVRFTENTEDDIESETQKVIDYYMEDE